jgi:hypothetical protein
MNTTNIITIVGITIIFLYAIIKILNFYGIGSNAYGVYLTFYIIMLFSILILPNYDQTL